jgi:hypothetical protein
MSRSPPVSAPAAADENHQSRDLRRSPLLRRPPAVCAPPHTSCGLCSSEAYTGSTDRPEWSTACHDARVSRRHFEGVPGDALAAGVAGAACSAIPSTLWSLARGDDVLEAGRAAGAMLLPHHERRTAVLLVAATPVHLAISIGWAAILATALPRGREPAWGIVGGMLIATLDLALIGRRIPSIRTLPQGRQWADHAAYGLSVGLVLRSRRSGRAPKSTVEDTRGVGCLPR